MAGRSRRGDAGSVLALVPAGFLVLIVLAALAVDSAVAYQAQGQLHDALAAAANDSVTGGLDSASFYGHGRVILTPSAVAAVVCQSVEAQGDPGLHHLHLAVAVSVAGDAVEVAGSATVDAVFGRALPGFGSRTVSSSAEATVSSGAAPAPGSFGGLEPVDCPGASSG